MGHISLFEVDVKILPKYYKLCSGLWFTYDGYEDGEADLMSLEVVTCLVSLIFDGEIDTYTLNREDKLALGNRIQNEGRCQMHLSMMLGRLNSFTHPT